MTGSNSASENLTDSTRALEPVSKTRAEALDALRSEIQEHDLANRGQSYLDKAVSFVASPLTGGEKALDSAKDTYKRAISDSSVTKEQIEAATRVDHKAVGADRTVTELSGEAIKTGSLFLRGRLGLAATLTSYALSQAKPADSVGDQMMDMTMGSAKGLLLKGAFSTLGKAEINFAAKGVLLGTTSRSVDLGLNRSTWQDLNTGQINFDRGLSKMTAGAINPTALVSDVAVFGVAGGLSTGINRLTNGALEASPLLRTSVVGASFGATGGAYNEIRRERLAGEDFSLSKVVGAAALHGTITGVAAIPGGLQAAAAESFSFKPETKWSFQQDRPVSGDRTPMKGYEKSYEKDSEKGYDRDYKGDLRGTPGSHETIFDKLESSEQANRLTAFKAAMTADSEANLTAAPDAVKLLPSWDRLPAVEHLIKTAPDYAGSTFDSIPPEKVSTLTSKIFQLTGGDTRSQLLDRVNVGNSSPSEVARIFKSTEGASTQDLGAVRSWFQDVQEPLIEPQSFSVRIQTPVRDGIVDSLSPNYLGRLLFEGRENGVDVEKLAAEHPQIVKDIARSADIADDSHMQNSALVVARWQATNSLKSGSETALKLSAAAPKGQGVEGLPDVISALAPHSRPGEVEDALQTMAETTLSPDSNQAQIWTAAKTAGMLQATSPTAARDKYFAPVKAGLSEAGKGSTNLQWRQSVQQMLSNFEN
jgi:hypothetical protein